jgi:acyl-CoA dehydrogenase
MAWLLRLIAFPLGRHRRPPSDRLTRDVARLLLSPSEARDRLTTGIYLSKDAEDATGRMERAFLAAAERDRIEEKIRSARPGRKALADLPTLVKDGVISEAEAAALAEVNAIVREVIDVDDFAPEELTQRAASPRRSAEAAE